MSSIGAHKLPSSMALYGGSSFMVTASNAKELSQTNVRVPNYNAKQR